MGQKELYIPINTIFAGKLFCMTKFSERCVYFSHSLRGSTLLTRDLFCLNKERMVIESKQDLKVSIIHLLLFSYAEGSITLVFIIAVHALGPSCRYHVKQNAL